MIKEIVLDDTAIQVEQYQENMLEGLQVITVDFKVKSEDYHDITTLLYKGTFRIKVPERKLAFTGTIRQYTTSITNLYEKGQVGDFHLSLIEIKERGQGV